MPPKAIAFDVIETLFSLDPIAERFEQVGLLGAAMQGWFAGLIRDAMALEITGTYKPFKTVAASSLEVALSRHGVEPTPGRVQRVLSAFRELPAHPDVRPAFQILKQAGVPVMALSNGAAESTIQLLNGAGLAGLVARVISIDEVNHWKPARAVYLHAVHAAGARPEEVALIAAHPWDIHGAASAGLTTGWVARTGAHFPPALHEPNVSGPTLGDVVDRLLRLKRLGPLRAGT